MPSASRWLRSLFSRSSEPVRYPGQRALGIGEDLIRQLEQTAGDAVVTGASTAVATASGLVLSGRRAAAQLSGGALADLHGALREAAAR
ncbi:MAG: hypothetical protein JSV80_00965, partial [Acidobacteriota bacterium]